MERILVPVDGSSSSDHAVRHVISLLKRTGDAEVDLLHVQRAPVLRDDPEIAASGLAERLDSDEADRAFAPAERLLGEAGVRHNTRTATGDPAQEIALYADVHGCSEIVMGTHGMGRIKNLLLGSVATKVLHLVKVPVTLVK